MFASPECGDPRPPCRTRAVLIGLPGLVLSGASEGDETAVVEEREELVSGTVGGRFGADEGRKLWRRVRHHEDLAELDPGIIKQPFRLEVFGDVVDPAVFVDETPLLSDEGDGLDRGDTGGGDSGGVGRRHFEAPRR